MRSKCVRIQKKKWRVPHIKIEHSAFGPGPKLDMLLENSLGKFWQTPSEKAVVAHVPVNCPSTQKFTLPEAYM